MRRFFPAVLTREESDAQVERLQAHIDAHAFGFWAVEVPGVAPCIGFVGLQHVRFEAPFTPAVEAGWRLARAFWGRGYATEGARAALAFGFSELGLDEIVAFAVTGNTASIRVMERLGMTRDADGTFDHPQVADARLRRHALYRAGPGALPGSALRSRRPDGNP